MGMTVVEKILARAAGLSRVQAGDVVEPAVDLAMSHENAALVVNQFFEVFKGTGLEPVIWDPSRVAIIFDHRVPAESAKTAGNQKKVREFVGRHMIRKFHDIRGDVGGICHQILPENGYVRPGSVVVGTDSHTTSHGALGAFAFGIGATEMASVWSLGVAVNIEVPRTIKINVTGQFGKGVGPKDLILRLVGLLTAQGANFKVIEFHGEAITQMSTSGRLVLCNMSVEAGATSGIVPADGETTRYLREEAHVTDPLHPVLPDPDSVYAQVLALDVRLPARTRSTMSRGSRWSPARRSTRSSSAPARMGGLTIWKPRQGSWMERRLPTVCACWFSLRQEGFTRRLLSGAMLPVL
jgi:3-isopropylmalate/(R)-2-methylmalate dehydratase large subunit